MPNTEEVRTEESATLGKEVRAEESATLGKKVRAEEYYIYFRRRHRHWYLILSTDAGATISHRMDSPTSVTASAAAAAAAAPAAAAAAAAAAAVAAATTVNPAQPKRSRGRPKQTDEEAAKSQAKKKNETLLRARNSARP